jgi:hypothetical protein
MDLMQVKRPTNTLLTVCLVLGFTAWCRGEEPTDAARDEIAPSLPNPEHLRFFEAQIRPLLADHCLECHGRKNEKGGVRLDSLAAMVRGGDSGPAIVPGKPDDSLLMEAVRYEGYEMPPSGPLADEQIEALETWIRIGAPWPGATGNESQDQTPSSDAMKRSAAEQFDDQDRAWWAIAPVLKVTVPTEQGQRWARNEIDHFVARQLNRNGLTPAGPASKETLIRRLCLDLTGLPPTPAQIESFLQDESDDAYEKLVDRLLESPAYGERFARHWLDVARYADSDGYRADFARPNAWRYRDYVIRSLNDDKPYDRFVKEQIAGDELYPHDPAAHIATGFLTHGIYEYNSRDVVGQWDIMLNEITDTIGDVFLGVGMQCSRCHNHKFDPILQKDFFALRAFVEPILIDRETVCATKAQREEFAKADAIWKEKTEAIRTELAEREAKYRDKAKNIAVIKFPASIQAMMQKPEQERTPREHQLAELAFRQVDFEYTRMDNHFSEADKDRILSLRRELQKFDSIKPEPLPLAQAVRNTGRFAPPTLIPKKQIEVAPGFLTILGDQPLREKSTTLVSTAAGDPRSGQSQTVTETTDSHALGRRSELANWIADAKNPLSTRVIVNRVWQSHFGRGLAPNASDFGVLGGTPSHPALLDWLTARFLESGWRLKPLHRLIVTSATYRQSCRHENSSRLMEIDPRNQWYWRGDVRRLDAEQIRDSILSVSDRLDLAASGPAASDDKYRRSIYTVVKRNSRNPLLDAFDLPLFFSSTASRDTTTNPLQSLMLINSQAMLDHAKRLADRVAGESDDAAIEQLWQLVYGRSPGTAELRSAKRFVGSQMQRYSGTSELAKEAIETSTLPYREGAAIVIRPDQQAALRSIPDRSLAVDEFTVEAIFQLGSVYETGSVRSIVSTWAGSSGTPGWTFGVTGKGSRRKPQTLVLHAFGNDGKMEAAEAAIFSDQHVDLGKPYYAAASIRLATDDGPGEVTFYLKDLSDEEQPISVATMEHPLVGGFGGRSGIAIGGRMAGQGGVFDGLIDDVRLSRGQVNPDDLLLTNDSIGPSTIGYWRFEPSIGLEKDLSEGKIHLRINQSDQESESPERRALTDLCHVLLNSSEFLYVR